MYIGCSFPKVKGSGVVMLTTNFRLIGEVKEHKYEKWKNTEERKRRKCVEEALE
jgi:hypothetical protein